MAVGEWHWQVLHAQGRQELGIVDNRVTKITRTEIDYEGHPEVGQFLEGIVHWLSARVELVIDLAEVFNVRHPRSGGQQVRAPCLGDAHGTQDRQAAHRGDYEVGDDSQRRVAKPAGRQPAICVRDDAHDVLRVVCRMKPFRCRPSSSLGLVPPGDGADDHTIETERYPMRSSGRDVGDHYPHITATSRVPPGECQDRDRPNALILDTRLLRQSSL